MNTISMKQDTTIQKGLKFIDCDVHPHVNSVEDLYPYMTEDWVTRLKMKGITLGSLRLPDRYAHPAGGPLRLDAAPPSGGAPGSDPDFMIKHYFDQYNLESAILIPMQPAHLVSWVDVEMVLTLVKAFNEYYLNEWIPKDKRFKYAMVVTSQDPVASAAEIRRLGQNENVVAIYLPLLNILMGNRYYRPIIEAAVEMKLPIVTHVSAGEGTYIGLPETSGGIPSSYSERYCSGSQMAASNINSLVFEGIFEKYPTLQVGFVEYGTSFLLSQMWRMDKTWKELRVETPWVKKFPSEYIRDHIRLTTQPLDEPVRERDLITVLDLMHAEEVLMFSSDYPHWDNDMPTKVLNLLPEEKKKRIYYENARAFYRF
jgi:uncharacterized protein